MRWMLIIILGTMLARPGLTMDAASQACRLFVESVLPGLLPYMALSQMLVSRTKSMNPLLLILLGWGGGSPTGGRLLGMCPDLTTEGRIRLAVCCATMSPMFLMGTIGRWLGSSAAGVCVLMAVLAGGAAAGAMAGMLPRKSGMPISAETPAPLSLGQAVEQTARTLLMVCGTMAVLRVFAALGTEITERFFPWLTLPITTLLEVTTGAREMAALPLPLAWRTALIAGATGFGGMAVIMQNRAVWPRGMLSLPEQILWQEVHGGASFLISLGIMQMLQ